MQRRFLRFAPRLVLVISSFAFLIGLALPHTARAHDGQPHDPEASPEVALDVAHEATPDIVVSASPGGERQVYLPVIIVIGEHVAPTETPTPEPVDLPVLPGEESPQDSHAVNDYTLAEEARKRDEPPFEAELKDIKAAEAPGDLITLGEWSAPRTWPFVFASAAYLPDGRIVGWGGNNPTSFSGGSNTYAAIWDPATDQFTAKDHSDHSMFCAIPTMLEDGRVHVAGGDGTRERTSLFDFRTSNWTRIENMSTGRWYPGNALLPNGKVFTAMGDPGGRYPEVWTQGSGWSLLNGADMQGPIINQSGHQNTWLPYFHVAPDGRIFHSGPTTITHWINTNGNGSVAAAGINNTWYPKYGAGVMYDEGKILVAGGMQGPFTQTATNKAQIFTLNAGGGSTAQRTLITGMNSPRKFHNGVVLPNGEVLMIGGNTSGAEFSDDGTVLPAEIWNPTTQAWRTVASMSVPRNYHSVALLMADGRVFSGGGGLCACNADHPNHQIYTPGYLFNTDGTLAIRPTISSAPRLAQAGTSISVLASTGVQRFTMIRMAGTTHHLNSDMRFLNVPFTGSGPYQLNLHSNPNVLIPGYWMMFALNAQGTPSMAWLIQVASTGEPRVTNPGNQTSLAGAATSLAIAAADPNGTALTYSATGLPPGLSINTSTGLIAGTPPTPGIYPVSVSVSDGGSPVSVSFSWSITGSGPQQPRYRYVRLVALSQADGYESASAAEVNVLDATGNALSRTGWMISTNSQETEGESGEASNAIDGNPNTIWHTEWSLTTPRHPHWLSIDMVSANTIGGFRYLPRTQYNNSHIANYAFYVSNDGVNWGNPVAQGTFANTFAEKTVTFNLAPNTRPALSAIGNQTSTLNTSVNLPLSASDADGDTLMFSASGLPNGLAINPSTGVIAGTPSTAANFNVNVTVSDGKGGSASQGLVWVVQPPPQSLALNPINSLPSPVNTAINYTASSSNGVNVRYKWLWGDGSPETAYSTSPNASHSYTAPGLYTLRLTATDNTNAERTLTFVQAVHLPHTSNRPTNSMNILYETRASGNPRVWVVNQDNDSVSVFDAVTNGKVAEISVGAMPRSVALAPNGNVWVANKGAASISIISPSTLAVAQTVALPYASQPFGVAFAPTSGSAFVALEATGRLLKLDASNGAQTGGLDVGPNVRGVAVSADGASVLVSRFVTPRLPGEEMASINTSGVGGEIVVVNAGAMTIARTVVLQHSDKPDTENQGSGVPNYVGAVAISPDGASAWAPSKQDNVKRGALRNGNGLNFQSTVRAIVSRLDLSGGGNTDDLAGRVDHDNSSVSSASAFDRYGNYVFTALETSREVAVIDAYNKQEITRFGVGRAPQGLAVSADGLKLYVNNFMDRTVQVFDLSALMNRGEKSFALLATYNAVVSERLSAPVLNGKRLFYDAKDPRLARDSYLSCASCHNDGGQDGRVWDFTGVGEGLRNTVQLRGRSGGQGFLHWSANFDEVQDFEAQIRNFAGGTGLMTDAQFNTGTRNTPLGDAKAGVSADLDALAAYLASLNSFALSPYRNSNGTLTADAAVGKTVFQNVNCAQCHGGVGFSSSGNATLFNIGTLKPSSGQRLGGVLSGIDPPTLRDVWATGPYLHDGSAATLNAAVSAHTNISLNGTQIQQVVAYLQQIGSLETSAPSPNIAPNVSLSAPANNATFTAPATVAIAATASDSDGTVSKVEFFNGATKLGEDTTAPYSFSWANVAAGAYALTAIATDNTGAATPSAAVNITVNTAPVCALPSGWASQDIGSPGQAGSACESGGAWTVKGGGVDIWSSSDQFRFAYRSANASTSTTIIARVTTVQNTDVWAKAGAMFRDGTAANARFVMVVQMPNNEVALQWRSSTGGSASWNGTRLGGTASVKWVRLVKSGSTYTAYYSTATGVPTSGQWVQISTARTVTMSNPKPGLAVTAHNNGSLNTSTFTGVSVTSP